MTAAFLLVALVAGAGFPLYLSLTGASLVGFLSEGLQPTIFFGELLRLAGNQALVAIPLFTLAGYILAASKAPERLVRLAQAVLGWMPGGLAVVSLLAMALLATFTGGSGITIVALGGLLLPSLLKSGYSERFGLGLLTSSASIGLLFPPSLPIILYGVVSEAPIDKIFLAGIIPGCLMLAGSSLYSLLRANKSGERKTFSRPELGRAIREAIWELPLPVLIIGGIYGGVVTTGEAAVVMVIYLLIVELLVIKDIRAAQLPTIFAETAVLVGEILLILGAALALTNYLVYIDLPSLLLDSIKGILANRWAFLFALNLFLLVIGSLMEIFSALVVVVPLLLPLAANYGIHPIHLAIIFLTNMEVGFCTPPFGLNLFISAFRFRKPVHKVYAATWPFFLINFGILLLVTYIPDLSLGLLKWLQKL